MWVHVSGCGAGFGVPVVLWCASCASRAAGAAVVPWGVVHPPPPTAELSLPWCLLHSLYLQPPH